MNTTQTIIIIAVLSLFAMISCSTARMVNNNENIRSQASPCNPSDELKIYELSLIWSEAKYSFVYWDKIIDTLDWDAAYREALTRVLATNSLYEYYMELTRFVALLRDDHTSVYFPNSLVTAEYFSRIPILTKYMNGEYIISNVDKSYADDIPLGAVIKKWEGLDIQEYMEKYVYPYNWHEKKDSAHPRIDRFIRRGAAGSNVEIEFEYEGITKTISLTRSFGEFDWVIDTASIQPSETLNIVYESDTHRIAFTEDNIAIITIAERLMNDNLPIEFLANYTLLENADGYILDISKTMGGNAINTIPIAATFIGGDFIQHNVSFPVYIYYYAFQAQHQDFGDMTWEQLVEILIAEYGEEVVNAPGNLDFVEKTFKMPRRAYHETRLSPYQHQYDLPGHLNATLVVLSSAVTGSAAEDFLVMLDQTERVTIVGSSTYGSSGNPNRLHLESGGRVIICSMWSRYPDGREYINIGIQPHIEIENTIEDLKNGVDAVMNRGLEEVRRQIREK
ncbi:MAG: S41 family peptidase [Candidatus Cloacimonetes bacterium]|nr:S41 family peptidase [Candidatus Cloacimonadota bacterium]